PAAPLVPAVLRRRRGRDAGDDRPVRVRDRHDPPGGVLGEGGPGEPRAPPGRGGLGVTSRQDDRLLDCPPAPVACRRCAAEVQVRKSSWEQTSIQDRKSTRLNSSHVKISY